MDQVTQDFVAIDPGLRHCGMAQYMDGRLVRAALVRTADRGARDAAAWRAMASVFASVAQGRALVIERMQADQRTRRAQVASLLDVAAVSGAIVAVGGWSHVVTIEPREWSRGLPKTARGVRVMSRLSDPELVALDASECQIKEVRAGKVTGATDHILDAVGIGLHYLGRLHLGAS